MAISPDTWFAVFRGVFRHGPFEEPLEKWAVTHWFNIPGTAGFVDFAHDAIRGWFLSRWTAVVAGEGSPITEHVHWLEQRTTSADGAQVKEEEGIEVHGPGGFGSAAMLPTQCCLLILGRTAVLGLGGRLYLPGISRGYLQPLEPSFRVDVGAAWLSDWWRERDIFGLPVRPRVVSVEHDIEATPIAAVQVRWPRTQRRRTKDLPAPFRVIPID